MVLVPDLPSEDDLRDFDDDGIIVCQVFAVALENVETRSWPAIRCQQKLIEREIDLEDREVGEILPQTIYRQDCFPERFPPDFFGAAANPVLVKCFRINLPDPSGVAVTCGSDENAGVKTVEAVPCHVRTLVPYHPLT